MTRSSGFGTSQSSFTPSAQTWGFEERPKFDVATPVR
jgi:hypothetical protein